jgi:hypothetical protein
MSNEQEVERWAERAMDVLDRKFMSEGNTMTQSDYDAEVRIIKVVADDAMSPRQTAQKRKINPRFYTDVKSFTEAYVANELIAYPKPDRTDDYLEAKAKLDIRAQVAQDASERAYEIYDDFLEHAQELYERGVGPSWD